MATLKKLFIVRKWVLANSISDAIKREKNQQPDDIFVDDDWRKMNGEDYQNKAIGYAGSTKKNDTTNRKKQSRKAKVS